MGSWVIFSQRQALFSTPSSFAGGFAKAQKGKGDWLLRHVHFGWPRGAFFNFDHITQPWFLSPGKYPKVWAIKFSVASLVWQVWCSWHVNALMWPESRIVRHGPNASHSFNAHPVNIYYVLELHNKSTHSYHIDASLTSSCFWAEKNCCVGQFLPGMEPCKYSATLRLWKDVFLSNWH